jgi:predicted helicase
MILTLSDQDVPPAVQKMFMNEASEMNTDDASKLIGCINALSKQFLGDDQINREADPNPMRRAVAFCARIKDSKRITNTFNSAGDVYIDSLPKEGRELMVSTSSQHIDGSMSAPTRDDLLSWLKEDTEDNECRILTNVRCLSEGVDVPSLDAVLFLSARNSQVDVVQSVGRVMRKSPGTGKKYGYIIIPVVVPSDIEPEAALNDNERFRVVWTVLNALRAHDDRFEATVNKIDLNKKRPSQINVIGTQYAYDADGNAVLKTKDSATGDANSQFSQQLALQFEQYQSVVFARMVNKVGDRGYWEQWAKDVAQIAERQTERIRYLISEKKDQRVAFDNFLGGLQKNINPSIVEEQAVEMLAQHIITKPIFEALFEGYSFVKSNAVSTAMQGMMDALEGDTIADESETLQKFYDSVRKRAEGIDNAEGKQRIIIELYDKFFKTAFPKMVEQLGIVYTPVEVVDFIIHSVNDVLKKEFGRSISDENVHVLDPFTGTGTFITRLLQSGLIEGKDLARKYQDELHANEIVLLAYYIAAVNIENAYHDLQGQETDYEPFEGIVLTDTFQLGETDESEKLFSEMFPQNSARVERQKKAPLRVIMGNPPYSVGQKSANDNAQNQKYEKLDSRIAATYATATNATNKNSLYDSYIKAFRWSTDRLDPVHGGVIAFVSNGAWLDGNSADGFRKVIEKEFSSIWVFNLRGNQRTSGELSRREGGKIFGSGSRTPISVTFLVKNPKSKAEKATIHYHDIGDYLSQGDKLSIIKKFKSLGNSAMNWKTLEPNEHGDWVNERNEVFETFLPLGDKSDKSGSSFFKPIYSRGLATARDAYCYNSSASSLESTIMNFVAYYNEQRIGFHAALKENNKLKIGNYLDFDTTKVTWNRGLKNDLSRNNQIEFSGDSINQGLYRPFFKQHVYFARELNDMVYQLPKVFPINTSKNLSICISAPGGSKIFTAVLSDSIPDLHLNGDTQCFPLYHYEENSKSNQTLFSGQSKEKYTRKDGITDFILTRARKQYGKNVEKEDIFYYVYGLLHSPDYRTAFANDLKKMLPRLPLVDDVRDFWKFSKAGRALADLHLNYETVAPHPEVQVSGGDSGLYTVQKMRFAKMDGEVRGKKKKVDDKSIIYYNSKITLSQIPAKAYAYIVNGKSAIEWIMERYQVKTDKKSGIKNDPNDWSKEVGNERYILDLLLSIVNVSVQTVDVVDGLPGVEFES